MEFDAVTVTAARVYEVSLPLRVPFTISGGSLESRRSLVVELRDNAGNVGYGESAPFELPFYSPETLASVRACLIDVLLPNVVGKTFDGPAALYDGLSTDVRGNHMARAGVDTGWWDLVARRRGGTLGGLVASRLRQLGVEERWIAPRAAVDCGVAIGIPPEERVGTLEREVRDAVRAGYRRVKIKVRPGWCAKAVETARRALREENADLPLWVDGNGAFDRYRDADELRDLDRFELEFVEQPFAPSAWWDSTEWNRRANTPICLDESLTGDLVARQLLEMQGPRIWNLKVQRLGGLEETCRVYARGVAAGVRLWVGTMPETGLGAQAALAVARLAGCVYPTDVEPSERWYEPEHDLIELRMVGGRLPVGDEVSSPRLNGLRLVATID